MKKIVFLLFFSSLLIGCNSEDPKEATKEVQFPDYFFSGMTQDEIKQDAKNSDAMKAEFLEDGTVVYHYTEKKFEAKLKDIESSLKGYLGDVIVNQDYPSILNATANKDYSQLTFVVDKDVYENNQDQLAIVGIGISATYYQLFLGQDPLKVTAKVVDSITAQSIETLNFPDELQQ